MTGMIGLQQTLANTYIGAGAPANSVGAGAGVPASGYAGSNGQALASAGLWMQIGGALTGALGTYFEAKSRQYAMRSQAMSMEFEQTIAGINARLAENAAQQVLEAGQQQAALSGLRYAQMRASARASAAARGVGVDQGSAGDVTSSIDYAREVDRLTINVNTVREANAQRARATDLQNRAAIAGVSASNLRGGADSINAAFAAGSSILGSSGRLLQSGADYQARYRR